MHNGRSKSSKVIVIYSNRKLSINFVLVINSNFDRILHRFRDIAAQSRKIAFLPYLPCFEAPAWGGTPSEFLHETYPAETRGMGLLYGENCIILTSNAFDWSTRVTDRRTDGQTEKPWHIGAIAYMLSRVKIKHFERHPPLIIVTWIDWRSCDKWVTYCRSKSQQYLGFQSWQVPSPATKETISWSNGANCVYVL